MRKSSRYKPLPSVGRRRGSPLRMALIVASDVIWWMAIAVTFQARVPSGQLLHKLLHRLQELKICRGPAWDKKKALDR